MNAQETILKFYQESDTNEALCAALDAATSADQVVEVARQYGYEFTKEDMAAPQGAAQRAGRLRNGRPFRRNLLPPFLRRSPEVEQRTAFLIWLF